VILSTSLAVDLLSPEAVATASRGLTAVAGLLVAGLAYRGYRRNDARKMLWLAVGIGLLTAGTFLVSVVLDGFGIGDGGVLLSVGAVNVLGLSAILYAFVRG
jgi:ABC-type enterochelin transport system permease subunit